MMNRNHNAMALAGAMAILALPIAVSAGPHGHKHAHGTHDHASDTAAPLVHTSKRVAPLSFHYELLSKPVIGQPLLVDLYLTPASPMDNVNVSVAAQPALSLGEGLPRGATLDSSLHGAGWFQRVQVTPTADGRSYLFVNATGEAGGQMRGASFAVPIQVGSNARLKAVGTLSKNAAGRAVVSLPAVVTSD